MKMLGYDDEVAAMADSREAVMSTSVFVGTEIVRVLVGHHITVTAMADIVHVVAGQPITVPAMANAEGDEDIVAFGGAALRTWCLQPSRVGYPFNQMLSFFILCLHKPTAGNATDAPTGSRQKPARFTLGMKRKERRL
nr:hypothetical protein [Tanacetum cinerariifolium]